MSNPATSAQADKRSDTERPPRLVLRFAVYTGVVLLAAGLAILWTVDREIAVRAERTVEAQGRMVTEENLRRRLLASDFEAPVRGKRLHQLDNLFRRRILIPGIVGTRLFNRDGTVTYAARHQLIGTKVPYAGVVRSVFAGKSERRVTRTTSWQGEQNVKVLQSLIPVRVPHSVRPLGALELDQDYRAVDITIGDAGHRLVLILAAALLILYLSLFPILRRVTGQLEARNRRLREQGKEREVLLEAERTARAESESIQRLLADQNERLRELDRMKDEFVSLVSHELRTPLTSIRGYLALMGQESENLTPEHRGFLDVVDRNAQRLLEIVGDLLLLARVDAGTFSIDLDEVDLARVVNESLEAFRPIADERSIGLDAKVGSVPHLEGDPARLAQVLDNLISNALKFTPSGGTVTVSLGAGADNAVLEVTDTGLGIARAEQPRLFERFFRSTRATEDAIPGTGLGLTITKAIVERHAGRISIDSEEGDGTTVRVELPLRTPAGTRLATSGQAA